jgi:hypothetical protein
VVSGANGGLFEQRDDLAVWFTDPANRREGYVLIAPAWSRTQAERDHFTAPPSDPYARTRPTTSGGVGRSTAVIRHRATPRLGRRRQTEMCVFKNMGHGLQACVRFGVQPTARRAAMFAIDAEGLVR